MTDTAIRIAATGGPALDAEDTFRLVFAQAPIGIALVGLDYRLRQVNRALCRLLGYTEEELLARTFVDLTHPDDVDQNREQFDRLARGEISSYQMEKRYLTKGGEVIWGNLSATFVRTATGEIACALGMVEDITDRKRAEEALARLTARVLRLQDEERHRIARELHDETGQNLFALTLNLARIEQLVAEPSEPLRDLLAETRALGEQALREIRTLSYLLHPPMLDQAGLISALRWYVDGFVKRSGIAVDLDDVADVGRLSREAELALFRVVQEALTNVHRHSGSATATVQLRRDEGQVVLRVRDEGGGLPVSEGPTGDDVAAVGVGIAGMRQRLRQLDGRLDLATGPAGTTVTAVVPCREAEEA